MASSKRKPNRSGQRDQPLTWKEHMFIRPEDRRVIESWSNHYGWSTTVAKRNFTVYRALEWLAAVLEDQVQETKGWFWCQQERICSKLGLSRPTVRAAIEHLVEIDVLEHERRWLPQAESLCSWFRLKIPPSCAGRVQKDGSGSMLYGLRKPAVGTSKNSTRRVQNFYAPSSSSKREIIKRERAEQMAEIQDRCIAMALDVQSHAPEIHEIVQQVQLAKQRREREERRALRSAGKAEFLDVRRAAAGAA